MVRASDRAVLAFTVSGRLRGRSVEVGDRVRRGQRLAWLESKFFQHERESVEARLARAEIQLSQRRLDAQRLAKLGGAGAVTEEQVERASSDLEAAAAGARAASVELREASRALGETVLRAPFDAVVAAVRLEPGETANAGEPAVELTGSGAREVQVELPVATAAGVHPGAEATVEFPLLSGEQPWDAKVLSVGSATERRAGLLPVTVLLGPGAPSQAVPGTAARVRIPLESESELSVPVAAIVDPAGESPAVMRVSDGLIQRVAVHVESLVATRAIVEGDLAEGQKVVISGVAALRHGDRVQVQP